MDLRKLLFLVAVLMMIVGPSAAALVEDPPFCSKIRYSKISFALGTNHTIPLFDSSKGILVQVDVNLSVNGTYHLNATNTNEEWASTVNVTNNFFVGATMVDGSELKAEVINKSQHYVDYYDDQIPPGTPPCGFNFTILDNNTTSACYVNCENLKKFTATTPGEKKIFFVSSGGDTDLGPVGNNFELDISNYADSYMCVKYTYDDSKLNITKTGNTSGPVGVGDVIEYEIQVCNPSTVNVSNVIVYDSLLSGSPFWIGTLNSSECKNVSTSLNYTVTEDDVCFGWINNTAKATGEADCGYFIETDRNATWNVSARDNSSINITKNSNRTGPVAPGDKINYTITVCNTGNLTVNDVVVHDNRTGDHQIVEIPVGQCRSVSAIYTVTQQDICNGSVNNSANATGEDYCNKSVSSGPAWSNVSTEYNSSINITKNGNRTGPVAPGDKINYTITVCNTGNLTVNDVVVHDNRTGDHQIVEILVGQCRSVSAIYTVTEQDICNGSVNNSANATGTDYCGNPVSTDLAWSNVSTEYNSSINITKVANTSGPVSPGDEIEYTITVCNTGNLTLYNVNVSDNRTGEYSVAKLEKGECDVTRRTYVVAREDLCKPIVNIVVAEATDACGGPVNANDSAEVDTVCYHCISGSKYWDKNGNGFRDDNDPPLENWTIFVDLNDSGILDPGEPSATTDVDGHWQICDLIPGAYNVSEVILEGWGPTDPPRGYHDPVNVTTENLTGIDFLNTGIYCISGHKRWDRDGDGVADPTDEPLENWTIFIDEDGDRTADPREPVTTTGGDGFWKICNLPPGSYTVCEEMKSDWIQTCPRVSDCYSVEIVNRSAMSLEFLNYKHERQNENFIRLGDQSALAWDMSYVDGLAKNKIDIDKTQTQREGCSGTDLFNFGNITVDDQVANSTGPGTSGNEIKIVTSQS